MAWQVTVTLTYATSLRWHFRRASVKECVFHIRCRVEVCGSGVRVAVSGRRQALGTMVLLRDSGEDEIKLPVDAFEVVLVACQSVSTR